MGLVEQVASGDRRASLEALRDMLAESLVEVDPRYRAALAKQLVEVLVALDSLPRTERSRLDELADRRARRRPAPEVPTGT